jgi:protein-L-isoaspartate(D-aspartate) O-methyltransferase
MPVRSAEQTGEALSVAVRQTGQTRPTTVPSDVLHHDDAGLWLALLVPGVTWLGFTPTDGSDQVWLFATDGSWAIVDDHAGSVEQYGPRALWDEIETAYEHWRGPVHRPVTGWDSP